MRGSAWWAVAAGLTVLTTAGFALAQAPAGEIASLVGKGEYRQAQQLSWRPAKLSQPLFPTDWVQTHDMSRMAIKFADGNVVQLGANGQLQVVKTASAADPKAILEVNKGRAWTQSKTSAGGLEVRTPSALAAIRGTDWEIDVDDQGNTTIAVFSGEVELSNDKGSVLVAQNEQARAERGKAPVKLLLRTSRERIQWVTSFKVDTRRYAETPADIAAMVADQRLSEAYARVRQLSGPADAPAVSHLLLSDFEIFRGDLAAAKAALTRGAARYGRDIRFDVALSRIALLEDDVAGARAHVQAALAKRADAPDALLMLGDIERHEGRAKEALAAYGKAVQVAAKDGRGWYGLGAVESEREDVRLARSDLSQAIALDESEATYRAELGTLEGFAGNFVAGRENLQKALALQPDNYVALTGLGVLEIKTGNLDAALDALQKASLIEPRYARAHVYLAAAYYQTGSDAAALFELKRAEELDPNDPLPHLLTSIIHLDRIEPGLAVAEAQEALKRIPFLKSLNQVADNQKGVANVGAPLAFMGLEAWARSAAHESYLPFWGGSHLFLADRYAGEFDRRSELMQGFITDPIVFGASNRFQSLVLQPGHHATVSMRYARSDDLRLTEPVVTVNGYDASRFPIAYFAEAVDSRIDPRDLDFSARARTYTVALGAKPTHELATFVYANRLSLDADLGAVATGTSQGQSFTLRDANHINGLTSRIDGGARYAPNARSSIWLKAGASHENSTLDEVQSLSVGAVSVVQLSHFETRPRANDVALRHTFIPRNKLEVTWGAESARLRTPKLLVRDALAHPPGATVAKESLDESDHDRSDTLHAMVRWGDAAFRAEAGAAWTDYRKDRSFAIVRVSGAENPTESYRRRKVDPFAGVVWRVAPESLVRAACRRWARPISLDTLGPVAIAGVPLDDQLVFAGGTLEQCRGQFEWTDSHRTFLSAHLERSRVHNLVSSRDGVQNTGADVTNVDRLRNRVQTPPPKPDLLEDIPVYREGIARRANVALERIVVPSVAARLNYTYTDSENTNPAFTGRVIPYLARHQANVGVTVAPGWRSFITVQAVYRTRRFTGEANLAMLRPGWDAQVNVFKESNDKRWAIEAYAANLAKKDVSDLYGVVVSYRF